MSNERKGQFAVRYSDGPADWGAIIPEHEGGHLGSFASVKDAKAGAQKDAEKLARAKGVPSPVLDWDADEQGQLLASFGGRAYVIENPK